MPIISQFYGIIVRMFYAEHAPPHFHVFYGEYTAVIDIHELRLREGFLLGVIMYYNITDVRIAAPDILTVTFADGTSGSVRFAPEFFTGVFAPLRDVALFRTVTIDSGALSWPNNVDIAPDALHKDIAAQGEAVLR